MATYRKVSEVVALLADKGFCAPHVIEKKGMGGNMQKYVEWHEVVRMLDEVFGPFGWDAVPTSSFTDLERGVFIYDGYIAARAIDDETGQVVEMKKAGRGMGAHDAVSQGQISEIDRQGHGAKSDFYSNTSKALGDGFGLYLYPSKVGSAPSSNNNQSSSNGNGGPPPRQSSGGKTAASMSDKQKWNLVNNCGVADGDIATLPFDKAKALLDAYFDNKGNITRPAPAQQKATATASRVGTPDDDGDDLGF